MSVAISCASTALPPRGLLADEDVLADLWTWNHHGLRTALVTLVGIEGAAPRPLGAQMAVAEDGRYVGYVSGGCLEQAIVLEAQDVIRRGRNRLVRYGKGSPYFDIRLPCGSGLDMYFDCSLSPELMGVMAVQRAARKGFVLKSTLTGLASEICTLRKGDSHLSTRNGDTFARVFLPRMRLLLLGSGPALPALATLAGAVGIETEIWSPDETTRRMIFEAGLAASGAARLGESAIDRLDSSSAVVLVFHEHDIEPRIIEKVLRRDCFYIGVLGNRAVHQQRLQALAALGVDAADLARLRAPVGAIHGAKTKATLAVGILAELLGEAKIRNLVA